MNVMQAQRMPEQEQHMTSYCGNKVARPSTPMI